MEKHTRTKTKEQSPCKDAPPRSLISTQPLKLALLKFPCGLCGVGRLSLAAVVLPGWDVNSASPKEHSPLSLPGLRQRERDAEQGSSPRRCPPALPRDSGSHSGPASDRGVGKVPVKTTPPFVLVFVKCAGKRRSR